MSVKAGRKSADTQAAMSCFHWSEISCSLMFTALSKPLWRFKNASHKDGNVCRSCWAPLTTKAGAAAHLWYSHLFKCSQPITWLLSGVITPHKWLAGSFLLRLAGWAGWCHLIYWRWRRAGAAVDWPPGPRRSTPYLLLHLRQRGGGECIKKRGWMLVTEHRGHLCCCCLCPVDLNDCVMCWYPVVGDSKFKAQVQIFILVPFCDVDSSYGGNLGLSVLNALSSVLPWSYKHSHYFISCF